MKTMTLSMMRRGLLALALAGLAGVAQAQADAKECAVLLLHGKPGNAQTLAPLARKLQPGCTGRAMDLPWSGARADAPPALQEITRVVRELKRQGFKRVVVAGQGVGANAALAFAGRTGDADAVIAIGGDPAANPEGLGELPALAAGLRQHTPLLWLVGGTDAIRTRGEAYAFAKAPPHPGNRYLELKSDLAAAPDAAAKPMLDWIKSLD